MIPIKDLQFFFGFAIVLFIEKLMGRIGDYKASYQLTASTVYRQPIYAVTTQWFLTLVGHHSFCFVYACIVNNGLRCS